MAKLKGREREFGPIDHQLSSLLISASTFPGPSIATEIDRAPANEKNNPVY